MISAAKLAANRANALRSTGPKTPEGKAAAARNSLKFGLFATTDIVPEEDKAEYTELCESLCEELAPVTQIEAAHAIEIVSAIWQLRRILRIEAKTGVNPLDPTAQPIARARASASCALNRAMKQLRNAQTDRFARSLALGQENIGLFAQADMNRIFTTLNARAKFYVNEMKMGQASNGVSGGPVEVEFNCNFAQDPEPEPAAAEPTAEAPNEEAPSTERTQTESVEPEEPAHTNRTQTEKKLPRLRFLRSKPRQTHADCEPTPTTEEPGSADTEN